jgi:hypothetical protein
MFGYSALPIKSKSNLRETIPLTKYRDNLSFGQSKDQSLNQI